jgi:hypothetical protein
VLCWKLEVRTKLQRLNAGTSLAEDENEDEDENDSNSEHIRHTKSARRGVY